MEQASKPQETPQHKHDCAQCVFLGRMGSYDLYFHDGGERPIFTTLVARDGEAGEYISGLPFSRPGGGSPELQEARHRAMKAGFGPAIAKAEVRQ